MFKSLTVAVVGFFLPGVAPAALSKQPNILPVMANDTVFVRGGSTRIAL